MPDAAADLAAGLALIVAGAVLLVQRPRRDVGWLLTLAGVTWFAGDVWPALLYAHRGPLVHALLTYPSGRTRSRLIVTVVVAAYVDGLVPALARSPWLTIVLMAAVVGAAAWRRAGASGPQRGAATVSLAGATALGGALVLAAIGRLDVVDTDGLAARGYEGAIVLTAIVLVADPVLRRPLRAAATGLVVDLADRHEPQALRAALARAVGDPALAVAYRVGDRWVDEAGQPMPLPTDDRVIREVTVVEDSGTPVAALVHDPAALRDEALARSVAAAVRLAVANVRLQADVAARVREVAESRRRLVEAGDAERRHLREQLRAGAERDLAEVAIGLAELAEDRDGEKAAALVALAAELDAARADLARFAQGVHPRALTEQGLRAALVELADQSALPVVLTVPQRRFPVPQEAAAFFVCSEGLANVAKYAGASRVRIEVAATDLRLFVRVADDGAGGADPANGSGLRGLADRVEALGGALAVRSPPGAGTRLDAELPICEAAQL